MISDALPIAFAIFLVRFIASEASFQRARRTGSSIHFPVGIGLRITFRLGGPFLVFVGYKMAQQSSTTFDQTMALLAAALGIGCLLAEPGEILIRPDKVVQKSLLGMKEASIAWEGASARHIPGLREVLVIGADGTPITHSQYHVGQEQFLHELKQHGVYVQS